MRSGVGLRKRDGLSAVSIARSSAFSALLNLACGTSKSSSRPSVPSELLVEPWGAARSVSRFVARLLKLPRRPLRVTREEATKKPELIHKKGSEAEANHA